MLISSIKLLKLENQIKISKIRMIIIDINYLIVNPEYVLITRSNYLTLNVLSINKIRLIFYA